MTTVVNLRRITKQPGDFYVGRGSGFGNPFRIGIHGSREEVIALYKTYFYKRVASDAVFRKSLEDLRGRRLVCHCMPKGGFNGQLLCHGQIIAGYLDDVAPESVS